MDNSEYIVSHTETKDTGIRLFSVKNPHNGFLLTFAEFNPDFDVHVSVAWTGARTSRSDDPYNQIFQEVMDLVQSDPKAAAEKIEKFGLNYGHSSILGMVPIFLFINNIPIEMPFWLFNHTSIGDGQELSSRYVNFKDLSITDIVKFVDFEKLKLEERELVRKKWIELQEKAVGNYEKWKEKVRDRYIKQFMDDDQNIKIPESTLTARVLDIARMWIPIGATTSMCLLGNLRMWNEFIKKLKETGEKEYIELADQIKYLLQLKETDEGKDIQANLSGLVKHTDPKFIIQNNLDDLKTYLEDFPNFHNFLLNARKNSREYVTETNVTKVESVSVGEILVMQYILVLYPFLDEAEILAFLRTLTAEVKKKLGEIILNNHNQFDLMGNMGDVRGDVYIVETAIAYLRDLNRHRANGRMITMLETEDVNSLIDNGFNKNYQLMETEGLKDLLPEWESDAEEYYNDLRYLHDLLSEKFPEVNLSFLRKLFPLGHQTKMHFSAPITQWNYLLNLRSTGGNDFGNRNIVYKILLNHRQDEYLAGMLPQINEPKPNSLEEFKSRK